MVLPRPHVDAYTNKVKVEEYSRRRSASFSPSLLTSFIFDCHTSGFPLQVSVRLVAQRLDHVCVCARIEMHICDTAAPICTN